MTGGHFHDNDIAVLRVRSELFSLEDYEDDQLHPASRPRTALGLHSASIRITEFGQERANPQPRFQHGESSRKGGGKGSDVPNQFLSPSRLRAITGADDLTQVYHLNLTINCTFTSLGNFGSHLPNLTELVLTQSTITSVRDLGTSLTSLRVLSLARCGLKDLDGVPALPALQEIHAAFNLLSDISLVSMLTELELLNLEGNLVSEVDQLGYLALCPKLSTLTLQGNPICPQLEASTTGNYRSTVLASVPQLKVLDNEPMEQDDEFSPTGTSLVLLSPTGCDSVSKGQITSDDLQDTSVGQWEGTVGSSRLEESSDLTHGLSQVICGNPVRALRQRHRNIQQHMAIPTAEDLIPFIPSTLNQSAMTPPPTRTLTVTPPPNRPQTASNTRRRHYRRAQLPAQTDTHYTPDTC